MRLLIVMLLLSKNHKGSILIPLIILLLISTSVLLLSKFLSTSQANVETAIDSRYQTSLSAKMDPPNNWVKAENKRYKFSIFYPKQWVGSLNPKPRGNELFILEKFLSNKIKLKVTVMSKYEIPQGTIAIKFNKNTFHLQTDESATKLAILQNGGFYYLLELTNNTYFAEELDFKSTFFQILKKFEELE